RASRGAGRSRRRPGRTRPGPRSTAPPGPARGPRRRGGTERARRTAGPGARTAGTRSPGGSPTARAPAARRVARTAPASSHALLVLPTSRAQLPSPRDDDLATLLRGAAGEPDQPHEHDLIVRQTPRPIAADHPEEVGELLTLRRRVRVLLRLDQLRRHVQQPVLDLLVDLKGRDGSRPVRPEHLQVVPVTLREQAPRHLEREDRAVRDLE